MKKFNADVIYIQTAHIVYDTGRPQKKDLSIESRYTELEKFVDGNYDGTCFRIAKLSAVAFC